MAVTKEASLQCDLGQRKIRPHNQIERPAEAQTAVLGHDGGAGSTSVGAAEGFPTQARRSGGLGQSDAAVEVATEKAVDAGDVIDVNVHGRKVREDALSGALAFAAAVAILRRSTPVNGVEAALRRQAVPRSPEDA